MALYLAASGEVVVPPTTHAECARTLALAAEQRRYEATRLYDQDSVAQTAAYSEHRAAIALGLNAFHTRYEASQAAAAARAENNRRMDVAHFDQATAIRRFESSPVTTAWGVRVPPY
eukprot:Hpha_TRINITY_DN16562_c0_g1::TRINITY_DN16562_c0_g1_i1::g.134115::m.134115